MVRKKDETVLNQRKPINGIVLALCSVCDTMTLTIGDARKGGVRWCQECVKQSFGWFQMTADQRKVLTDRFEEARAIPVVALALEVAAEVPGERRKAAAIGESRLRLLSAYADESRD